MSSLYYSITKMKKNWLSVTIYDKVYGIANYIYAYEAYTRI